MKICYNNGDIIEKSKNKCKYSIKGDKFMRSILFTASTYSHIINFHIPYIQEFKRQGFKVDVACGGKQMEIPQADEVIHISFEKSITSPKNFKSVIELYNLIKKNNYTIISCHTSLAAFFTRLSVIGMKKRPLVVNTAHGYLFNELESKNKNMILSSAEKMVASVTDLLMTMNEWDTRYAKKHKLGKYISEIKGMGLNTNKLQKHTQEEINNLRKQLDIVEDKFILIYAAEFSKRKSQQVLIDAMAYLPEDIVLVLAGEGVLYQQCKNYADKLGLSNRIYFPGQVKMSLYYSVADLAVSSSKSEGLPFNIMEAMYYGLPIVASRIKGHKDLLENTGAGLLYNYGDFETCAEQILRVYNNKALKLQLGKCAKKTIEPYLLENVLPDVMNEYKKLLPYIEVVEHT